MKFTKLLPLALCLSLMAGCSGKSNEDVNTETPTEDIVVEITEPVEITFWHAMNGDLEKSLQELTDNFMAENENVKVTLQNQSSYADLQQKLASTTASPNHLPTLTQSYIDWLYNPIQDGLVANLKPYIEHEQIGFDNYDDVLPSLREASSLDGNIYGVPFNKSTEVLYYNKTLLDELGLQPPTNYEELASVSKEIKDKKGITGAGFDVLNTYFTTYLNSKDVVYDDSFDPTSPEAEEAVQYYLDGVKDGYFRIAGTDNFLSGPFGSGTLAMYVGSNGGEKFALMGVDGKFDVGVAPSPTGSSLQQGTDLFIFNSATNEQKTAAFEYIKFLTTTENQIKWATETGYMPVRTSAVESDEYKNSGSLVAPILADATANLYSNPVLRGADAAYREAGTVLEGVLADTSTDVKDSLKSFKSTLMSVWE